MSKEYNIGIYIRLSMADEDTGYGSKAESDSIGNQRMLINRFLDIRVIALLIHHEIKEVTRSLQSRLSKCGKRRVFVNHALTGSVHEDCVLLHGEA